ncbi:hypothetical protein SAMN02745866_02715 [Alteromonadaceae bacterium Bs31]|nr:hypothetical protein SAMN02745866_02715 [Alteromonadaceae bacterium Bs31]
MINSIKTFFTFIALVYGANVQAYVYCETKVSEIWPHKSSGTVYFKFTDGTAIQMTESDSGLDETMSVVLAALHADREVKIALNDGEACGSNRYEKWSYVVAISNSSAQ